jgi:hypothetical protein
MSNPVFSTPDGTNSPIITPGWTSQGIQLYTKVLAPVFSTPDKTRTPATAQGWTVQSSATGSDQNTVQGGI